MSGFKKIAKDGTNSTETVSTGVKSLDELVNVVPGSVVCFYEDKLASIHNILIQVFISACSNDKKEFYVLSTEEKLKIKFNRHEAVPEVHSKNEHLVIAWRYKQLDSSKHQFSWDLLNKQEIEDKNQIYSVDELLIKLKSTKNCNFAIFSLFAPLYGSYSIAEMNDIFYDIRKYTRLNGHVVIMSFPAFFFDSNFNLYFDSILQISNNLSLPQETPLYNCFIETLKLSTPEILRVNNHESFKYGLILRSKKIKIERIDIQPEDIVPRSTSSCGVSF